MCVCVRLYETDIKHFLHIIRDNSSAKETRTGAQPMRIARVDVKRWRKKEGRQRPTPTAVNAKTKEHYPLKAVFRCSSFLMHEGRFQPLSFFLRCLSATSLFAGRNVFREVNEEIKKRRRHTYRRELAEEAASSTVKIGIHTRKYYPRHHCQGK